MTKRGLSRSLIASLLIPSLSLLASCNQLNLPGGGGLKGGDCPDMATVQAIGAIDFQGKYKVNAEAAMKLESSLKAAASIRDISGDIEKELLTSCSGLASDLGAPGNYADPKTACDAAARAMTDVRAKLSASARIYVQYTEPVCRASVNAMAACAAECQANVQPGEVDVKCEGGELAGQCEGQCSGSCDVEAGAKCAGTCKGECTADFKGKCDGTCNGKCNGKNANGHCAGTCTGSCDLVASGSCKGECKGSCELKGKAECGGTCTGKCSVAFKEPMCTGTAKPPQASAECEGSCQAQVEADVQCSPPQLAVVVEGSADAQLATNYQNGLERHLPNILKVSAGMKDRIGQVLASAQASIEAGQQAAVQVGSAGVDGAKLAACVRAPFESALKAVGSIQANVDVSVSVSASASASAGGGASAAAPAAGKPSAG